jgi:uncharacterized protein (DUF2249 family)
VPYTPFKHGEEAGRQARRHDPGGLAAYIDRKKYGNAQLEAAAKGHHSLRHAKPKGKHHAQIAKFVKRHHRGGA